MDQKMRAYTAWVVQQGKGEAAMYLDAYDRWQTDIRKALQLARRTDARKLIEAAGDPGDARAVEKTFG
jgi:hypothetical protein